MRYECRDEDWSGWSVVEWREGAPCHLPTKDPQSPQASSTAYYHVLWLLLAVIAGLVFCLMKQEWIKKNLFQIIPDAKNVQYNMLNFSHSAAWWDRQTSSKVDCVIVEVEEVSPSKLDLEEKKEEERAEEGEEDRRKKEDYDNIEEQKTQEKKEDIVSAKREAEKEAEEAEGEAEEKQDEQVELVRTTAEEVNSYANSMNISCNSAYIHWGQTPKTWPSQT
ncbi:cytokine receptor-like factor 2 [Engraulis encrasicolus]|uniref:cytokine receptor-like factor 2 n=1 Tax=Engraulis encrasicolus TaxID=184585 RepID=UPI002FD6AC7E